MTPRRFLPMLVAGLIAVSRIVVQPITRRIFHVNIGNMLPQRASAIIEDTKRLIMAHRK